MVLTGRSGWGKMFFLRFSTDAIVLLAHWVREGVYCYAVGTTPSGTGAALYPWSVSPIAAEVQHSAALVHSHLRRTSGA